MARDGDVLAEAVYRSCVNKAKVVAEDEREGGRRAILNLGHTFGHAIETAEGYGSWLHGEAVAAGMCMAAELSFILGWLSESEKQRIKQLCKKAGLPVHKPSHMKADDFIRYMQSDKKNVSSEIRFVLLKSIGESVLFDGVDDASLRLAIERSQE